MVELAVCLPVLITLLFATIEACRMIQLKQDLAITAYEGARIGVVPGATTGSVNQQCEMLLNDRGVMNYTVAASQDPTTLSSGDRLTVTVTADCDANSWVGAVFFQGKVITESVVVRSE